MTELWFGFEIKQQKSQAADELTETCSIASTVQARARPTCNSSNVPINHEGSCSNTSIVSDEITDEISPSECRSNVDDEDDDDNNNNNKLDDTGTASDVDVDSVTSLTDVIDSVTSWHTSRDSFVECRPQEVTTKLPRSDNDARRSVEESESVEQQHQSSTMPTEDMVDNGVPDDVREFTGNCNAMTDSDTNASRFAATRTAGACFRAPIEPTDAAVGECSAISEKPRPADAEGNHVTRLQSFVESLRRIGKGDDVWHLNLNPMGVGQRAATDASGPGERAVDRRPPHAVPGRSSNTSIRVHRRTLTSLPSSILSRHSDRSSTRQQTRSGSASSPEADLSARRRCHVNDVQESDKPLDLSLKAGRHEDNEQLTVRPDATSAAECDATSRRRCRKTEMADQAPETGVAKLTSPALADLVKRFGETSTSETAKLGSSNTKRIRTSSTFPVDQAQLVPSVVCTSSRFTVAANRCAVQPSVPLAWNCRPSPWFLPIPTPASGPVDWLSRGCLRPDSLASQAARPPAPRGSTAGNQQLVAPWTNLPGVGLSCLPVVSSARKPSVVDDDANNMQSQVKTVDWKRVENFNFRNPIFATKKRSSKRNWMDSTAAKSHDDRRIRNEDGRQHRNSETEIARRLVETDVTTGRESDVPNDKKTAPNRSSTTALTGFRCDGCGGQFDSLYQLTLHLETTGHSPVAETSAPSTSSPSADVRRQRTGCRRQQSTEQWSGEHPREVNAPRRRRSVSSFAVLPPKHPRPQRLVRGQDVWLSKGDEQTGRILRCVRCDAAARTLAELTMHMVRTGHYAGIVGPVLLRPETETGPRRRNDTGRTAGAVRI